MKERARQIRAFLIQRIHEAARLKGTPLDDVDDGFDLFRSGIFDSLGFVTLVSAVEKQFNLEIDFADWDPEEFTTLGGLIGVLIPAKEHEDV